MPKKTRSVSPKMIAAVLAAAAVAGITIGAVAFNDDDQKLSASVAATPSASESPAEETQSPEPETEKPTADPTVAPPPPEATKPAVTPTPSKPAPDDVVGEDATVVKVGYTLTATSHNCSKDLGGELGLAKPKSGQYCTVFVRAESRDGKPVKVDFSGWVLTNGNDFHPVDTAAYPRVNDGSTGTATASKGNPVFATLPFDVPVGYDPMALALQSDGTSIRIP
jgi:hypothetical protein